MKKATTTGTANAPLLPEDIFRLKDKPLPYDDPQSEIHVLKPGCICDTDSRGHTLPKQKSLTELVLDASNGFIPLWAANTTLRWRFRERTFANYQNPDAAKNYVANLLGQAVLAWGSAAPVKFTYDADLWDFEIVMQHQDKCNSGGCVLASAFFPDAGRHEMTLYPMLFKQSKQEQVETLIHEIGHVFGLRHFFAKVTETQWASEIFGVHSQFSIMNYGNLSMLTDDDRKDLAQLYQMAWRGSIRHINGTAIRFFQPFSAGSHAAANGQHSELDLAAVTTYHLDMMDVTLAVAAADS